ncbi:MAG: hypothetical protein ACJAQT_000127 [Akkermansiaceae bacterium]|jgi:hypothetical protein
MLPSCSKVIFLGSLLASSFLSAELTPFLAEHCFDCHDGATQKGGLNLEDLAQDFDDSANTETWIKIHDRLASGEMPPKKKKRPPAVEREPFLKEITRSLTEGAIARDAVQGRSTWRRMNRHEYENTVRDLLSAPWLDLKDILPEDGQSHRFSKSGEALDISHVQMARYMEAADHALRAVIAPGNGKHENKIRRFYAREQPGMAGRVDFNEFNHSSYRAMIPLLGTEAQPGVIEKKEPMTVGESDPETRELEALGVVASSYEPIQPRFDRFKAPYDGFYKIRLMAYSFTAGAIQKKNWIDADRSKASGGKRDEPVSLYAMARRSQRKLASVDVFPEAKVVEIEAHLKRGEIIGPDAARLFRSRPPGPFHNPLATPEGIPGVAYRWLEVEGPFNDLWPPAGHQLLFGTHSINRPRVVPKIGVFTPKDIPAQSREFLANFISKGYRRPATPEDTEQFLPVIESALSTGSTFSDALIAGYTAVLCSPGFLCFEEPVGTLDDHSLASRLSYFLWNSAPDIALRKLADDKKLAEAATLGNQVDRLLNSSKSEQFINAFLDSWLDLREINGTSPDSTLYPDYYLDDLLTESALDETRLFFAELVRANLPAKNLIDSDFTFLNERLARHYGIPDVHGVALKKVPLPKGSPRGGLMTQASVLKVTANGTTTSPILRGNWILERLLGQKVPPPPPGTPAVEPDIRGAKTIREQLEMHRDSSSCNTCHVKIDPPGFALESFDILGAWRDRYRALGDKKEVAKGFGKNGQPFTYHLGLPVNSTGQLANGDPFTEIRSFKKLILQDERAIARNIATQLITYGTGTTVRFSDRPALEEILNKCQESRYGLRTLIHEVIQSPLFRSK